MLGINGQREISGWLKLFVIISMYIAPLFALGSNSNEIRQLESSWPLLTQSGDWATTKQLLWFITWAAVVISFASGHKLKNIHDKSSVVFALFSLWAAGPVALILKVLVFHFTLGALSNGIVISDLVGKLMFASMPAIIWSAYLIRSVQVREIYRLPVGWPFKG